jgi:hypothetical protein
MAIRQTRRSDPSRPPASHLIDELLTRREAWHYSATEAADAYRRWSRETVGGERAQRFAAYAAALDREQCAAASYALAAAEAGCPPRPTHGDPQLG